MTETVSDTLSFNLKAQKTLVNDTVKLVADISALVTGETTEEALRADIRAAVRKLVDTDWQFSNIKRSADDTGFERVTVQASARIPESENYNLENRARLASRTGLTITDVDVDTSIPVAKLEEAERGLRAEILKKAIAELKEINELTGRNYRIGHIAFSGIDNSYNNVRAMSASSINAKVAYGSGFGGGDEDALGNASKISINASVTLTTLVYP